MERAKEGPAFMALHAHVSIVPIAITGTRWGQILPEWKRLHRPHLTLTFGAPFTLPPGIKRRAATDLMMHNIAGLLPPEYRGVYADRILGEAG